MVFFFLIIIEMLKIDVPNRITEDTRGKRGEGGGGGIERMMFGLPYLALLCLNLNRLNA